MSVREKGSVYEQPSVYQQGGGGGGGSTIMIPDYLQPVEYIDTTDTTGNIVMVIPWQYESKSDDEFFVYYSVPDTSKLKNGAHIFSCNAALGYSVSNPNFDTFIGTSYCWCYNGNLQTDVTITGKPINGKCCSYFKTSTRMFEFTAANGDKLYKQSSSAFQSRRWGNISVFGVYPGNQPELTFNGRFYQAFIKNNGDLILGVVPCKNKITNEPCIVDVATGMVGKNLTNTFDLSAVTFGPNVDPADITFT